MVNRHRGEVEIELDGRPWTLCLTLGALAELEQAFGAGNLQQLVRALTSGDLTSRQLGALIGAGLRGGGHDIADDAVTAMRVAGGLPQLIAAAGRLLAATFPPREAAKDASPRP